MGVFDNKYTPGDWNLIDDITGDKIKASRARRRWDNIITTAKDWDERHPADFLRVHKDKQKVPYTRNPDDQFESSSVEASDL